MLSKGVKFGVKFSKQGFGLVLGAVFGVVRVQSKQAKVWLSVVWVLSKDKVRVPSR